MSFSTPAPASGGFDWDGHKGNLVLVTVHEFEKDVKTVHGLADAIRADIRVIDGHDTGETYNDILIFPRVVLTQLRHSIGGKVLGRIGQGTARPGQSAPWTLEDPTDTDKQATEAMLAEEAKRQQGNSIRNPETPPF